MFRWVRALVFGPGWQVAEQAIAQPRQPLALPTEIDVEGAPVILRYLAPDDAPALLMFARALPPGDLLFLRRDITDPVQIDAWLDDVRRGLVTTVVAVSGSVIVGYATVASDGLAWTRHVRELRVLVSASMRGKHLGRLLIEQAFAIAKEQGARKMIAQMTVDQESAVRIFETLGFEQEARLHNQVVDREGAFHDLQIMSLDIEDFEAKLVAMELRAQAALVGPS